MLVSLCLFLKMGHSSSSDRDNYNDNDGDGDDDNNDDDDNDDDYYNNDKVNDDESPRITRFSAHLSGSSKTLATHGKWGDLSNTSDIAWIDSDTVFTYASSSESLLITSSISSALASLPVEKVMGPSRLKRGLLRHEEREVRLFLCSRPSSRLAFVFDDELLKRHPDP